VILQRGSCLGAAVRQTQLLGWQLAWRGSCPLEAAPPASARGHRSVGSAFLALSDPSLGWF